MVEESKNIKPKIMVNIGGVDMEVKGEGSFSASYNINYEKCGCGNDKFMVEFKPPFLNLYCSCGMRFIYEIAPKKTNGVVAGESPESLKIYR